MCIRAAKGLSYAIELFLKLATATAVPHSTHVGRPVQCCRTGDATLIAKRMLEQEKNRGSP